MRTQHLLRKRSAGQEVPAFWLHELPTPVLAEDLQLERTWPGVEHRLCSSLEAPLADAALVRNVKSGFPNTDVCPALVQVVTASVLPWLSLLSLTQSALFFCMQSAGNSSSYH